MRASPLPPLKVPPSHPLPDGGARPDEVQLLDLMLDWVPDEKTRNRILAENPARLYGF